MTARLSFDGSASPEQTAQWGYVLDYDGKTYSDSGPATPPTNNAAEWQGLIHGLQRARDLGVEDLVVTGDSQLVIYQVTGKYKVRAEHLRPFWAVAVELLRGFRKSEVRWVPRKNNARADVAASSRKS